MAAPQNVRASASPASADPLLNFKFLIWWDGKLVAGVSKVGALSRTTAAEELAEGGVPQVTRMVPGRTKYGDVRLERGLIIDTSFELWANRVWFYEDSGNKGEQVSLKGFRKDITIQICNQAGQVVKQYFVYNCWPKEYTGLPDLDASGNTVALESMTLANEGWQRDDSYEAKPPPSFVHPD